MTLFVGKSIVIHISGQDMDFLDQLPNTSTAANVPFVIIINEMNVCQLKCRQSGTS